MQDRSIVLPKFYRALAVLAYTRMIVAGAGLCWLYYENTARPAVVVAMAAAFLVIFGAYMLWSELGPSGRSQSSKDS